MRLLRLLCPLCALQGRIVLFRPDANADRMIAGAQRLAMVPPPKELFLEAVKKVR